MGSRPALRVKAFDALAEAAVDTRLAADPGNRQAGCVPSRDHPTDPSPAGEGGDPAGRPLETRSAAETLRAIAQSPTAEDEFALWLSMLWPGSAARRGAPRSKPWPVRTSRWSPGYRRRRPGQTRRGRGCELRAAELLPQAAAQGRDLTPLLAAFLNRQGGGDVLAAALSRNARPADSAKLGLRAVYALGHADPALVSHTIPRGRPRHRDQAAYCRRVNSLVAEVAAKGDPARGELIFRRADLNCTSCHSLNKAGGDVGPDLSSIGQTSPSDYIINSILVPDQSIKEQFHTLVVQTTDGQVFQGIVTEKDDQRIVLKDATGTPRVVPVASIEDQKPGGSSMPKGLVNLMTRAEFVDLVRFLSELGKPAPMPSARPRDAALAGTQTGPRSCVVPSLKLGVSLPGPPGRSRPLDVGLCQGQRLIAPERAHRLDQRQAALSPRRAQRHDRRTDPDSA